VHTTATCNDLAGASDFNSRKRGAPEPSHSSATKKVRKDKQTTDQTAQGSSTAVTKKETNSITMNRNSTRFATRVQEAVAFRSQITTKHTLVQYEALLRSFLAEVRAAPPQTGDEVDAAEELHRQLTLFLCQHRRDGEAAARCSFLISFDLGFTFGDVSPIRSYPCRWECWLTRSMPVIY
jgi:hypothetical protein